MTVQNKATRKKSNGASNARGGTGTARREQDAGQKISRQRNIAEFAIDPLDEELIAGLQHHLKETYGDQRTRAKILRASVHRGLLEEIALAGPDRNGFYAGKYTGKDLAELLRQSALILADLQSRHSTPILSAAAWPGMVMAAGSTAPGSNGATPNGETTLDEKGAAALKGLGTGLMKRSANRPAPPPE